MPELRRTGPFKTVTRPREVTYPRKRPRVISAIFKTSQATLGFNLDLASNNDATGIVVTIDGIGAAVIAAINAGPGLIDVSHAAGLVSETVVITYDGATGGWTEPNGQAMRSFTTSGVITS